VIAFPVDPAGWTNYGLAPARIEATMAGVDGAFHIETLPAGDYFVVAVPRGQIDAWQDPAFFKRALPRASRVTLEWGKTGTVQLTIDR
jgi:hypothetical protein